MKDISLDEELTTIIRGINCNNVLYEDYLERIIGICKILSEITTERTFDEMIVLTRRGVINDAINRKVCMDILVILMVFFSPDNELIDVLSRKMMKDYGTIPFIYLMETHILEDITEILSCTCCDDELSLGMASKFGKFDNDKDFPDYKSLETELDNKIGEWKKDTGKNKPKAAKMKENLEKYVKSQGLVKDADKATFIDKMKKKIIDSSAGATTTGGGKQQQDAKGRSTNFFGSELFDIFEYALKVRTVWNMLMGGKIYNVADVRNIYNIIAGIDKTPPVVKTAQTDPLQIAYKQQLEYIKNIEASNRAYLIEMHKFYADQQKMVQIPFQERINCPPERPLPITQGVRSFSPEGRASAEISPAVPKVSNFDRTATPRAYESSATGGEETLSAPRPPWVKKNPQGGDRPWKKRDAVALPEPSL